MTYGTTGTHRACTPYLFFFFNPFSFPLLIWCPLHFKVLMVRKVWERRKLNSNGFKYFRTKIAQLCVCYSTGSNSQKFLKRSTNGGNMHDVAAVINLSQWLIATLYCTAKLLKNLILLRHSVCTHTIGGHSVRYPWRTISDWVWHRNLPDRNKEGGVRYCIGSRLFKLLISDPLTIKCQRPFSF